LGGGRHCEQSESVNIIIAISHLFEFLRVRLVDLFW